MCAEECQKLIFPCLSFQVCRVRLESVVIARFASHTSSFILAESTFRASPSEIPIAISIAEVPLSTCLILPSGRVMLIIRFCFKGCKYRQWFFILTLNNPRIISFFYWCIISSFYSH